MISRAWPWVFAAGCYVQTDGIQAEVWVQVVHDDAPAAATVSGWLGVGPVVLLPCEATTAWTPWWWMASAHAHALPLEDAAPPIRVDMDQTDEGVLVATLRPAPGRYCGAEVWITPPGEARDAFDLRVTTEDGVLHLHDDAPIYAAVFFATPATIDAATPAPLLELTLDLDAWFADLPEDPSAWHDAYDAAAPYAWHGTML